MRFAAAERSRIQEHLVSTYYYSEFMDLSFRARIRRPRWASEELFNEYVTRNCISKIRSLPVLIWKHGEKEGTSIHAAIVKNDRYKSTLPAYQERYGIKEGLKKYKEKNSKLSVGFEKLKASVGEKKAIEIRERHRLKSTRDLDGYIRAYGEKEGKALHKRRCETAVQTSVRRKEYYLNRGCSEQEAKEAVLKVQSRSLSFFQQKHGKGLGKELHDAYRRWRGSSLEVQIEKYGEKEGRSRYKKWLSNQKAKGSLEWYLRAYGKKGLVKYEAICRKKSTTLKGLIERLGVEDGTLRYKEIWPYPRHPSYSKGEMQVADFLQKTLKLKCLSAGTKNLYTLWLTAKEKIELDKKFLRPDIVVPKLNLIVEYYGDVFHAAPRFKSSDKPCPWGNLTSAEIRSNDRRRMKVFSTRGYHTFVVWEYQWKSKPDLVKQKLKEFINEIIQSP